MAIKKKVPDRKVDIFELFKHINNKDIEYFNQLTEEEIKSISPLVVMRWLSGTSNMTQITFLNNIVNTKVFPLHRHKQLLYYLLLASVNGQYRYSWRKAPTKKTSSMPLCLQAVSEYFGYSKSKTLDALPLLTDDAILGYAEELGFQPSEITKLKKELKTR